MAYASTPHRPACMGLAAPSGGNSKTLLGCPSSPCRLLHIDAAITDDPTLMSHWTLENSRAGPRTGRQIPNSVLRRLTIDLEAPDGGSSLSVRMRARHAC